MDRVRSVFLSDIHLGTRACQAGKLQGFFKHSESELSFQIGDIIVFSSMSRGIVQSQSQDTVVRKILRKARHGVKLIFVPGNHHEALREYVGTSFGDIELVLECEHSTAIVEHLDGRMEPLHLKGELVIAEVTDFQSR